MISEDKKPIYALIITVSLWASAFVGIRAGLNSYHPGAMAFLRYLVASICIGVFYCRLKHYYKPTLMEGIRIVILGFFGFAVYNVALNYGEVTVPAGIASFIICQIPVMTAILAVIFLGERLHKLGWLGISISILGLFIITLGEKEGLHFDKGVWYSILAAFMGSAYAVGQKPLLKKLHPIEMTSYAIWSGTLAMAIYLPQCLHDFKTATWHDTAWVIYMGAIPGVISYVLWAYALSKMKASIAATYLYWMPIIAVAMAFIFLGEFPNTMSLVGGCVALLGAVIVNIRKKTKQS